MEVRGKFMWVLSVHHVDSRIWIHVLSLSRSFLNQWAISLVLGYIFQKFCEYLWSQVYLWTKVIWLLFPPTHWIWISLNFFPWSSTTHPMQGEEGCIFQNHRVGDITVEPGVLRMKTISYLMYGKETWYFNSMYGKSLASTQFQKSYSTGVLADNKRNSY